ncbi:MAG: GTPase ObgE [Proteobacteria bacterium]|nr:GTPase ObgE [Desulfobacula sp.]MBU3953179.1 GTPase ObgE [Pseudomonadota bacterium]MBU4130814.1 GTPase ObgE [Pseudomonadota bacterium]
MKFVDEAIITVSSGHGGAGCSSFRRERYIEFGGPDGGDGGDGGDVVLRVDPGQRTLYDYRRQKLFHAKNGAPGLGKQKHGKNGNHLFLDLPPGTLVSNADTLEPIVDLTLEHAEHIIARGGQGGRGNKRFATSTNRAPRFSQPGIAGVEMRLKLELKLLADVGIVGLPNAGKSTLISAVSSARPKIADYPFTTLTPTLGMVEPPFGEPFAMADIPGLIEGAHEGTGLGIKFLKHIERTGILIHLIDVGGIDPEHPLESFNLINKELSMYSEKLAKKSQIVVLNKIDLTGVQNRVDSFKAAVPNLTVLTISAVTGQGVKSLVKLLAGKLQKE